MMIFRAQLPFQEKHPHLFMATDMVVAQQHDCNAISIQQSHATSEG